MRQLFLIIGAPGSGKTTDANLIEKRHPHKITHYSTGDMLRAEVARGSEQGKLIDEYISNGKLVPLEIVIKTVVGAILNIFGEMAIIDGFPRSVEQMMALDKELKKHTEVKLSSVIEVEVSEAVAKERVLGRARGADDNEEVFNNRMKVYLTPLQEIQSFYEEQNLLHKINGERGIEEIVDDIDDFIQAKI